MQFSLNADQLAKLAEWNKKQDDIVHKRQLNECDPEMRDLAKYGPYYGAIGGALTYCFTPTSVGVLVKVQHSDTKAEIDLTGDDFG